MSCSSGSKSQDFGAGEQDRADRAVLSRNQNGKPTPAPDGLTEGDWRGHPDGSGTWRAPLAIQPKPAARSAGSFLEEDPVDLDEHPIDRLLPFFCIQCGDEFVLSPSGHQLCANRLCRDGFDVSHLTFEDQNRK